MSFRTKLLITSMAIVFIPIILTLGTFFGIGRYLVYQQRLNEMSTQFDYGMVSDPSESFAEMSNEISEELKTAVEEDPFVLEDRLYLQSIDKKLASKYSFLIYLFNFMV